MSDFDDEIKLGWKIVGGFVLAIALLLAALLWAVSSYAQVPPDAERYKRDLIRNVRLEWGLNAPIASFAGQIEQESGWNPEAKSRTGALGLAQFMPATATWISGVYADLADNTPRNPQWAMRAMAAYDKYLKDRVAAETECHAAAKMLSAYNGGLGNLQAEERLCKQIAGCDSTLWWDNVERVKTTNRTDGNWAENRGYPPAILFLREPRYVKAGWGTGFCQHEAY